MFWYKLKSLFAKKLSINPNQNTTKAIRERERERVLTIFLLEKYGLNWRNDIKFIQNKMGRKIIKYKKEKLTKE